MKKIIILTIIFTCPLFLIGQDSIKINDIKRNSFYCEAFGQGLYDSFTFDRLYHVDKDIKTSFSAGLTLIPHPDLFVVAAPISYNFIFGKKNHHLELGLGFTIMNLREGNIHYGVNYYTVNGIDQEEYFIGHSTNIFTYFTPKIGYRFQKTKGGLFMRLTLTPSIAFISVEGNIKGGQHDTNSWDISYSAVDSFFSYRFMPWAGISFGKTFKK